MLSPGIDGPDPPPETLSYDGYRAKIVSGDDGMVAIMVRLFVAGEPIAEAPVWAGNEDDDVGCCATAERLLPVVVAICRFLNTETDRAASRYTELIASVAAMFETLPAWSLNGVTYLGQAAGGTDVVYDLPGREHALRIVEDYFAEILGPDDLGNWLKAAVRERRRMRRPEHW